MAFKTIHTAAGLALMTQAEATGTQISLTHMAVGDGNGNAVTPDEGMTNLVRERYRSAVNRVYQDPAIQNKFSAELIIPAETGGFTLREIGLFDSNGTLFVVGNLPDTYKPTSGEGAYSDAVVRVDFMVTNSSIVQLIIDPNVTIATQQWILNTITVCALLPGGTTGQVLRKKSNACGDTEWANPDDVNTLVDVIEETQTLAAGQTVVDWAVVTNTGVAVFIEGVRLRADEWTPDAVLSTRITLAQTYPSGTKITGAQNEPSGNIDPLSKPSNLADVPDKAAARANLDVFSRSETRQMAPAGKVSHFARNTAPTGWLKANGAAVSRVAYAELFSAIGTTFGAGDGFNTFNLPDLRGEFIRGWDDGRGVDSGRAIGSFQKGSLAAYDPTIAFPALAGLHPTAAESSAKSNIGLDEIGTVSYPSLNVAINSATSDTDVTSAAGVSRPRNVALLACIKF